MKTGNRITEYVPDYVVFDLETTGTSCISDSIIEISAVKVKNAKVSDTFSTLVNPQRRIPYYATQVNGITDGMVDGAPLLLEALEDFLDFVKDEVLVGHNIHAFDLKFIYRAVQNLPGRDMANDYIDTLYMARQCLPQLKHHKLTDLAEYFHIDTSGAHRALNDCMMNQQCYERMAVLQKEMPKEVKADSAREICPLCGSELKKRNGRYGEFYGCSSFPKCRYTRNI